MAVGAASVEVEAAAEEGPAPAVLACLERDERDAGLFERAEPAGVCARLLRLAFLPAPFVADDEPALPGREVDEPPVRLTGARTGEVSMRDVIERLLVDAACPGEPSVWLSVCAAL